MSSLSTAEVLEVRCRAADIAKVSVIVLLWVACLASYFFQPAPPAPISDEVARQALNDAFGRAVSSSACAALPAAIQALAAMESPPEGASTVLDLALSHCADALEISSGAGLSARLFGECLGHNGISCYAIELASHCPTGLPCFTDAIAANLEAAVPGFADAFAAATKPQAPVVDAGRGASR